jgi:hypothetical protein
MKRILTVCTVGAMLAAAGMTASAQEEKKEGRIQQRKENQQKRIGEGIENGSLTAGEAAHLEKQETRLNREIRRDRKENGGNLTNKEKRQINRQQNRLSREIYNQKHDSQNQSK